jgi:hypothetical protein
MKMSRTLKTSLLALAVVYQTYGQGSEEYGSGLKINIDQNGSKYVRFIIWNQIWSRAIEMNPASVVNGQPVDWLYDIGIRRARMLAYAQINKRFLILTHFGINNQTFINGGAPMGGMTGNGGTFTSGKKPGIFFHDVWNEYAVVPSINPETNKANKNSLYIGTGLHYWHGVSRMTSASTLNFLAVDAPIFNWFTIEFADQFARYFGIYAKGNLFDRLDYRVHLSRPFATNLELPRSNGLPILDRAVENNTGSNSWIQAGYFMWQFLDKESNVLPFTVGTYVGTKRVFNIGGGFQRMPNATKHFVYNGEDTVISSNTANIAGLDVFLDLPFGGASNQAFTLYSVLYNHQWGPNYYRTVGIMNEASTLKDPNYTGAISFNGFGNTRPLIGTGQIWYTQIGYLLPKKFLAKKVRGEQPLNGSPIINHYPNTKTRIDRIQLFGAYTLHNLERIGVPVHSIDVGFNYFIAGHHAKITLQYSARPHIPIDNGLRQEGFKSEFILQTQVFL